VTSAGYTVRVISESGGRFDLTRTELGGFQTRCNPRGVGGCPQDRTWD
jgi:hypothetical protein